MHQWLSGLGMGNERVLGGSGSGTLSRATEILG